MSLSDSKIKRLRPKSSPFKVTDADGLFLLVQPSGSKLWKMKYHFNDREKKLSFGRYPDVSLEKAREKRDEARRQLADGVDPMIAKLRAEVQAKVNAATTFKLVAEEYIERMASEGRAEATVTKARWFLELLNRDIAKRPVDDVSPQELLLALRRIEAKGHRETANGCGRSPAVSFAMRSSPCGRHPTRQTCWWAR